MERTLGVEGENIRDLDPGRIKKVWLRFYDRGVRSHVDYPKIPHTSYWS